MMGAAKPIHIAPLLSPAAASTVKKLGCSREGNKRSVALRFEDQRALALAGPLCLVVR
jgi:hypothetical protein